MRYFIEGDASTDIVIWSSDDVSGDYTVNMYDDDQDRKSVTLSLPNRELNIVDPSTILGRPEGFVDGFIRWVLPTAFEPEPFERFGLMSWSIIDAPAFGAVQTVINPIKLRNVADTSLNEVRVRFPVQDQP